MNFTVIEQTYLSPEEAETIDTRGFVIKKILDYKWVFLSLFYHLLVYWLVACIGYLGIGYFYWLVASVEDYTIYIDAILQVYLIASVIGWFLLFLWISQTYSLYRFWVVTYDSIIINNHIYQDTASIPISKFQFMNHVIQVWSNWIETMLRPSSEGRSMRDIVTWIMSFVFTWFVIGIVAMLNIGFFLLFFVLNSVLPYFSTFSRYILSLRKLERESSHLSEISSKIIDFFTHDRDVHTLDQYFSDLSQSYNRIIHTIRELEQVEEKANQWNIFDSEKYIHSLRCDILEPLKSLKSFLEAQKEELEKSQWELKKMRVRVGGTDPSLRSGREQSELVSKRGELLREELTENIKKLDTMIHKIA